MAEKGQRKWIAHANRGVDFFSSIINRGIIGAHKAK